TLELTLATLVWAIPVAVVLGIVSAVRRATFSESAAMVTALVGQSMPSFWLGLMLILVFSVTLGLLPSSRRGTGRHLSLPAVTLGAFLMARLTRLVRSGLLDALGQDYIRTARAKGLAERMVIVRHALKNAAIPVVTIAGLDVGTLLGGAVITETVFAWPGVGRLAIDSISARDFPVVQADVFFLALGFVGINLLVDIVYTWLDPRVRLGCLPRGDGDRGDPGGGGRAAARSPAHPCRDRGGRDADPGVRGGAHRAVAGEARSAPAGAGPSAPPPRLGDW